jgi:hypothetical protein
MLDLGFDILVISEKHVCVCFLFYFIIFRLIFNNIYIYIYIKGDAVQKLFFFFFFVFSFQISHISLPDISVFCALMKYAYM